MPSRGGFWAGLADVLAGQQGADQTIAGIQHLERLDVPYPGEAQRYIDPRSGETRRMSVIARPWLASGNG